MTNQQADIYKKAASDPELQKIIEACDTDVALYGKLFHPEDFFLEPSSIHRKMQEHLDRTDIHKKLIVAPRGIGKTTTVKAFVTRAILYRKYRFILYISKSEGHAILQTEGIKSNLRYSKIIRTLYGDVKISDYEGDDPTFAKKGWIAFGHTFILPRGLNQQVRGLIWTAPSGGSFRQDLIIADDTGDDERLKNEKLRRDDREWWFAQVEESLGELTNPNWQIIYIDTNKHPDALDNHLAEEPSWSTLRLSICDDNYKTLAPDFRSQSWVDNKVNDARLKHRMDIFAREMQGLPVSPETAEFKAEYFKYYTETDGEDSLSKFTLRKKRGDLVTVVLSDPAKTQKMTNAETGFVVWSIDTRTGELFERFAEGVHVDPKGFFDRLFQLAELYECVLIGIETNSLEEYITQPLMDEMFKRGKMYQFLDLKPRKGVEELSGLEGGKVGRGRALALKYQQGLVWHNANACGALEGPLLSFPRPAKWDVLDAAAYIVQVLSFGNLFSSNNGYDDNSYEMVDEESEYEGIYDEPALQLPVYY